MQHCLQQTLQQRQDGGLQDEAHTKDFRLFDAVTG